MSESQFHELMVASLTNGWSNSSNSPAPGINVNNIVLVYSKFTFLPGLLLVVAVLRRGLCPRYRGRQRRRALHVAPRRVLPLGDAVRPPLRRGTGLRVKEGGLTPRAACGLEAAGREGVVERVRVALVTDGRRHGGVDGLAGKGVRGG